jgi:hypothetical protein
MLKFTEAAIKWFKNLQKSHPIELGKQIDQLDALVKGKCRRNKANTKENGKSSDK